MFLNQFKNTLFKNMDISGDRLPEGKRCVAGPPGSSWVDAERDILTLILVYVVNVTEIDH